MSASLTKERKTYKPVKRAPSDPEKKRKNAALAHELNVEIESIVSMLLARCDAAAEKFEKPKAAIRSLVFGGSKNSAFLSRRRVDKDVRLYDAYVHHRAVELNTDEEVEKRGRKLQLGEIRDDVDEEEIKYHEQPPELHEQWLQEYREWLANKNTEKRPNRKAEQQDASHVHKTIARELEAMDLRTGVKAIYLAVRSDRYQTIAPFYACSPDVLQFFSIVLGKTVDQVLAAFEMWAIGGIQGVLGLNAKSASDILKEVRRLIQCGLIQILEKRYPGKVITIEMNYASYEVEIVNKHGVELLGWTYGDKVCQPGRITPVAELRNLYTALVSQSCHWALVADGEWDPSAYRPKKRMQRSDANTKRPRKAQKTAEADSPHAQAAKHGASNGKTRTTGKGPAAGKGNAAGKKQASSSAARDSDDESSSDDEDKDDSSSDSDDS